MFEWFKKSNGSISYSPRRWDIRCCPAQVCFNGLLCKSKLKKKKSECPQSRYAQRCVCILLPEKFLLLFYWMLNVCLEISDWLIDKRWNNEKACRWMNIGQKHPHIQMLFDTNAVWYISKRLPVCWSVKWTSMIDATFNNFLTYEKNGTQDQVLYQSF